MNPFLPVPPVELDHAHGPAVVPGQGHAQGGPKGRDNALGSHEPRVGRGIFDEDRFPLLDDLTEDGTREQGKLGVTGAMPERPQSRPALGPGDQDEAAVHAGEYGHERIEGPAEHLV